MGMGKLLAKLLDRAGTSWTVCHLGELHNAKHPQSSADAWRAAQAAVAHLYGESAK